MSNRALWKVVSAALVVAGVALVVVFRADSDVEKLGKTARSIQGCDEKITVRPAERRTGWANAERVENVSCGAVGDGLILVVASYASPAAAANVAATVAKAQAAESYAFLVDYYRTVEFRKPAVAKRRAASDVRRRPPLCIVRERLIESWLSPYYGPDEAEAQKTANRWTRTFCARVGGRLVAKPREASGA